MADKKSAEELARQKKIEEELFAKTMGFTHTPSPEELERTVILTPTSHQKPAPQKPAAPQQPAPPQPAQPEPQDFESTVQFRNFESLVESDESRQPEEIKPNAPAPEKSVSQPVAPEPTVAKSEAKPATPPAKPPADELEPLEIDLDIESLRVEPAPSKPAAPKPSAPAAAAPSKPAPSKPAAPKPSSPAAAAPSKPAAPKPSSPAAAAPSKPAAPASPKPQASPAIDLDFTDTDFGLSDKDTSDSDQADLTEVEADFDSGAALDELDALLKMDEPDEKAPVSAETDDLQDAAIDIESDEDADIYDSLPDDIGNDALNASADSMPTVQLGATDMADENEFLMDSKGAQDGPVDLSDIDASLDESIKETGEESSDDKSESTEPGEPAADVEDFNEDEWDSEYASINNEEEQAPSVEDEPEIPIFAATESPAATDSAAETSVEPAPVQVIEKRKGSGFAIFLSLLALAGVGASFWLQLGPGIPGSSLESQLIQTVDRMNELQSDDRQLAMQIDELRQENDALKQQLNELALVVGNRTAAAKKKAARKARPVIKPSTPVKSAKPASAAPKVEGWVINLTSVSSAESAKQEIERLNKLGIEATSVRSEARGKIWYRIRVTGFATLEEAEAESALLSEKLGIKDIWVGKP